MGKSPSYGYKIMSGDRRICTECGEAFMAVYTKSPFCEHCRNYFKGKRYNERKREQNDVKSKNGEGEKKEQRAD